MMCGKIKIMPEDYKQDYHLCGDCTDFWLRDLGRRLKAGVIAMLATNWR
jgi:hypothetical protein